MKANNQDQIELINIRLNPNEHPIAFNNKVEELMEECGYSRKDAEKEVRNMVFEMELYYQKGQGLFLVESEALDSGVELVSPYNGEELNTDFED